MAVSDYSTTPDENVSISGINIAEGCAPSGINNAIRQMMADIKTEAANKASSISSVESALAAETSRANAAEQSNASAISANVASIQAEVARAKAAEATYLPLAGGTMSGTIKKYGVLVQNVDTTSQIALQGGTSNENGAGLFLYGGDYSSDGGFFRIRASYSNGSYIDLVGKPNGEIWWGPNRLLTTSWGKATSASYADSSDYSNTSGMSYIYPNIDHITGQSSFSIQMPSGGTWRCVMFYGNGTGSVKRTIAGGSYWAESPGTSYHCIYWRIS